MRCTAKIRPFPHPSDEFQCERDEHKDDQHSVTLRDYAYKGSESKLAWYESDRRTFRGDWMECPQTACILPAGHRGSHALS
jgi:hypothetical protein